MIISGKQCIEYNIFGVNDINKVVEIIAIDDIEISLYS